MFASMLADPNKFREGQESVIEVQDSDADTFKSFLKYLYSGKVVLTPENVLHLHHLAEKYYTPELASR